jgi:hypothetical protein
MAKHLPSEATIEGVLLKALFQVKDLSFKR